jgi:hypothetical protein
VYIFKYHLYIYTQPTSYAIIKDAQVNSVLMKLVAPVSQKDFCEPEENKSTMSYKDPTTPVKS